MAHKKKTEDPGDRVQRRGFGLDEGDQKHPGSRPKKGGGLGVDYGQGIGYGGCGNETGQRRSRTGAERVTGERERDGDERDSKGKVHRD